MKLELDLSDDVVAAVRYYAAKRGQSVDRYLDMSLSRLVPQHLVALDKERDKAERAKIPKA